MNTCKLYILRSEMAVFLCLGLAGVMMVSLALNRMTRFVTESDRIAAALAGRPSPASGPALADGNRNPAREAMVSSQTPRVVPPGT